MKLFFFQSVKILLIVVFISSVIVFSGFVNSKLGYYEVIPVVTYHHFVEDKKDCVNNVIVTAAEFEEHLKAYVQHGYKTIFLDDLYELLRSGRRFNDKFLVITFDDGYESNYVYAYPLLQKYNLRANISIVSEYIGITDSPMPMLNWAQMQEMENSGVARFYNHGFEHVDYSTVPIDDMLLSLNNAENILTANLKQHTNKIFVYPFGGFDRFVDRALKKNGFVMQVITKKGVVRRTTPLSRIPRININPGLSGDDVIKLIEGTFN